MARRESKGFTAYVYENDYKEIQKLVLQYPEIDTGGDLFGLWQNKNTVVIQLFIGPGKDCQRTTTSFHQDIDYLGKVGGVITKEEGLCNVGEWHSHHQIGMPNPSRNDNDTVLSNMPGLRLDRFVLFIASIEKKRKRTHEVKLEDIKIRCFIYKEGLPRSQQPIEGEIVRIPGINPIQLENKAREIITSGAEAAPRQQKYEAGDKKPIITNGAGAGSKFDAVAGLLECSICKEVVKNPRTLPCFHSYCKDCLDKYVNQHRQDKPREDLNCSVCRTNFTLDPEGVEGMPRNHFISNMLDVMTVQNQMKAVPCSYCQEPSVGRCVTCEVFMCKKCLQAHNDFPGFRDHSVLSMAELSKPENKAKIKGRSHCKKHSQKKLKFYCETCNELICRRCMDFDHLRPDHVCSSLGTVAEKKLEALKINYLTLGSKLSEGNEALQELTNYVQSLKDNMEKARREINERKSQILATVERMLEEKAKSLVNEAEDIFTNKHSAAVKLKEEVQTYVNKVGASADLSSTLIANGNDEEIVLFQKAVQENAEKLQSEYPEKCETCPK